MTGRGPGAGKDTAPGRPNAFPPAVRAGLGRQGETWPGIRAGAHCPLHRESGPPTTLSVSPGLQGKTLVLLL